MRCSARRRSRTRCAGCIDTVAAGPLPGYRYVGSLTATSGCRRRSARCAPRRSFRRRWRPATPTALSACASSARGRCVTSTRACARPTCARPGSTRARSTLPTGFERADMNTLGIARHFDDAAWRAQLLRAAGAAAARPTSTSACPAVLGLRDPHGVWSDLEHRLGRRVFEIPSLPPSVPGMRLFEILSARAARGRRPADPRRRGRSAPTRDAAADQGRQRRCAAGRDRCYVAPWFVLATGGFASRGDRARLTLARARARPRPRRCAACRPPVSRASCRAT